MASDSPYLTPKEAAAYLRISVGLLRTLGLGTRVSKRKTLYKREDLDSYMSERAAAKYVAAKEERA